MRKHAVLDNNEVISVMDLDENLYAEMARSHQLIIDIHDLVITPQVGWVLIGNQLAPPANAAVPLKDLIKARIKLYQEQAPELLRELYSTNTLLGITLQQSDEMFTEYQDVLIRIREGAWPTALYRLSQKTPSGFVTQEMIDSWSALITTRMI